MRRYDTYYSADKYEIVLAKQHKFYLQLFAGFPTSNPVGSLLYCWIQVSDGDPDYQDMVMESTNEEVAAAPEKASNNAPYDHFEILAEGITKLSVYPKYNPRIKQTFMLRVGGKGSQDISDMDVSLSKDTFIYDGNACKPEVTVSYRKDTVLEQGIDYTISYEKMSMPERRQLLFPEKDCSMEKSEKILRFRKQVKNPTSMRWSLMKQLQLLVPETV